MNTHNKTELHEALIHLSKNIHKTPELGFNEYFAAKCHVDLLKKYDFKVSENYLNCETAFRAEFSNGDGPTIAFMSEYDALPEIGHACGHNLIGMVSTGAAIELSSEMKKNSISGKIIVFGTPAEETSGFKVDLSASDALDNIDICMMAHPADDNYPSGTSLALDAIEFEFEGKSAHAASAPEKGINALDGVINTFNNINALRQQTTPDTRIHGIICNGGIVPNIIPEYASARFYARSNHRRELSNLTSRIIQCAQAGALASGTKLRYNHFEASYDELLTNQTLSSLYCKSAVQYGLTFSPIPRESYGSLDMGNVSHKVPTIHPYFKIVESGIAAHTPEFERASGTENAHTTAFKVISTFVTLSCEYLRSPVLQKSISEEFEMLRRTVLSD